MEIEFIQQSNLICIFTHRLLQGYIYIYNIHYNMLLMHVSKCIEITAWYPHDKYTATTHTIGDRV